MQEGALQEVFNQRPNLVAFLPRGHFSGILGRFPRKCETNFALAELSRKRKYSKQQFFMVLSHIPLISQHGLLYRSQ
jgi:hypothetical protein